MVFWRPLINFFILLCIHIRMSTVFSIYHHLLVSHYDGIVLHGFSVLYFLNDWLGLCPLQVTMLLFVGMMLLQMSLRFEILLAQGFELFLHLFKFYSLLFVYIIKLMNQRLYIVSNCDAGATNFWRALYCRKHERVPSWCLEQAHKTFGTDEDFLLVTSSTNLYGSFWLWWWQ